MSAKEDNDEAMERRGSLSRRTRRLSLSGATVDDDEADPTLSQLQPDDPCVPSGAKAFARRRSIGDKADTRAEAKSDVEQLVQHFEGTFNNSLMIVTERCEQLKQLAHQRAERADTEIGMRYAADIVATISYIDVSVSRLAHSFDSSVRETQDAVEPETSAEAMGLLGFMCSRVSQNATHVVRGLRAARRQGITVELLVDAETLREIDLCFSDAVEMVNNYTRYLRDATFRESTQVVRAVLRFKRGAEAKGEAKGGESKK